MGPFILAISVTFDAAILVLAVGQTPLDQDACFSMVSGAVTSADIGIHFPVRNAVSRRGDHNEGGNEGRPIHLSPGAPAKTKQRGRLELLGTVVPTIPKRIASVRIQLRVPLLLAASSWRYSLRQAFVSPCLYL